MTDGINPLAGVYKIAQIRRPTPAPAVKPDLPARRFRSADGDSVNLSAQARTLLAEGESREGRGTTGLPRADRATEAGSGTVRNSGFPEPRGTVSEKAREGRSGSRRSIDISV